MKIKKVKKSLGQNFLIDQNIINIITDTGNISKNDIILEVGPGSGNLTKGILSKIPKKVFTVEKDTALCKKLYEIYKNDIVIINEDILKVNEKSFTTHPMLVFGNLPYNISTQILVKWIKLDELNKKFKKFILMFQKEVADRIIANVNSKNYGRLSILTSWRMNVKKVADVSPNSFFPIPKVKSTILLIEPKSDFYKIKNVKNLEYITNIFFNQRRKMIRKPLNFLFKNNSVQISKKLKLNPNDRPQNLSPVKYFELCKEYEDSTS